MDCHEIWYLSIFWKYVKKIQVSLKSDKIKVTFWKYKFTILIISRKILLWMRNISGKIYRKTSETHVLCSVTFFRQSCHLWDNVEKYSGASQATMTIRRTACWIPKATHTHTHTHTKYVILIVLPVQKWLHKRPLMLCYMYIACLLILDSEVYQGCRDVFGPSLRYIQPGHDGFLSYTLSNSHLQPVQMSILCR